MEFIGTFWALAPSIIAITPALITKEVYSSLFIGILAGALLYTGFSPVGTLDTIVNDGFIGGLADPWNAGIMLFLVILGILVALINQAGGSEAFGRWASRNIKSRVGIMLATFIFGVLIFVDDYFNCLTVGSVMRPLSDNQRISRAKLAFLIDATAAPICMIAPISSWAAAVSGVVDESVYSGIELFIRAIPYNFYSILTIVFIITIIFMKLDYGPMAMYEKRARETGELGVLEGASSETAKHGKGRCHGSNFAHCAAHSLLRAWNDLRRRVLQRRRFCISVRRHRRFRWPAMGCVGSPSYHHHILHLS